MGMNGTRMRTFGGHLAAVTVGVLVAVTVLSGTAYAPPQTKPVNIADLQEPNNVADVSADGALEVEGTVTGQVDVGNLPAVQKVTSSDDPGRVAYSKFVEWSFSNPASFVVPARQRLEITYVSGRFWNTFGNGQGGDFSSVRLDAGAGSGGVRHYFVPTFTGDDAGGSDNFLFSEHTQIYADGEVEIRAFLGDVSGSGLQSLHGHVSVSGYLIDCSRTAPPCN